jgi:16S rRNA (cytidine1402-2'-O)-methyltransferase
VIACEDTRVSGQLFHRYGLKPRLVSYHEHNADRMRPRLLEHLNSGESVALISDAGSPLLSDPGFRLVNAAIEAGHSVIPIPGASAVTTALMAAGIATDRVLFAGFLPSRESARQRAIAELAAVPATLVLFESARRLADTLADLASGLGAQRSVAVCRELTKLFEEIRRGPLADVAQHYAEAGPPKGEVTLVIGRAPETDAPADDEEIDRLLNEALLTQSTSEAARTVARQTGRARQGLYARALELGRERP